MKSFLQFSAICILFYSSYGNPVSYGGGAYTYQDTAGNRYGGSYELKDGQVTSFKGDGFPIVPNFIPNFNNFLPQNFMNFGNFIPEGLPNLTKKSSSSDPKKQSDPSNTSNDSTFDSRFPFMNNPGFFGSMPGNFGMPNLSGFKLPNSAAAMASTGPGFVHQFAGINPGNPAMPNIDVMNRFAEVPEAGNGGFYSVSSSSYASSANVNGHETGKQGAETVVNNNGKVTKYSVHS